MRLDLVSFVIGLVAGSVLSIIVYNRRETIHRLWSAIVARLKRLRDQLAASVESRYKSALRAYCHQLNLTQAYADEIIRRTRQTQPTTPSRQARTRTT